VTDLQALPNIGPALAADLRAVGIPDAEALRDVGADEAGRRLAKAGLRDGTHATRALAGALTGVRWTTGGAA
jgi:TfoX-like protein